MQDKDFYKNKCAALDRQIDALVYELYALTAADCLAVLELAVNWEAEKLYGVEGLGPFDEF
jgi:hypothetical protein